MVKVLVQKEYLLLESNLVYCLYGREKEVQMGWQELGHRVDEEGTKWQLMVVQHCEVFVSVFLKTSSLEQDMLRAAARLLQEGELRDLVVTMAGAMVRTWN